MAGSRSSLTRSVVPALLATGVGLAALPASLAIAQSSPTSWPTRPVHLVVPFVPGGATDVIGRLVVDQLAARLGQPVVIENKPGAGGNIGATVVAKSVPDGYTMFVAGSPGFPNAAALSKEPGFDPIRDFVPVALLGTQPMVLATHPSLAPNTVQELVAYAKANPAKLSYGTPGIGTPHHVSMELFKQTAGISLEHIPFRGGAPMAQAVLAGEVPVMFGSYVVSGPHLKTGKLKALGVSSKRRLTQDTAILPMAEQGYPDFDVEVWFGIVAPTGTPASIVERMTRDTQAVLDMEEVRQRLLAVGYDPPPKLTSVEMGAWIKRDVVRWSEVFRKAGIAPE